MSQESSKHKFEVIFDETEQRALKNWIDGQELDAEYIPNAPMERGLTQAADGTPLEGITSCPDFCDMRLKCSTKKVVAECAILQCDGTETMRVSVRAVAERAAGITDAYKLFVQS